MPNRIQLQYVAIMREKIGVSGEQISTSAQDMLNLYHEIAGKYKLAWPEKSFRPVINDKLVEWTTVIQDGDRVMFLPPVSGG